VTGSRNTRDVQPAPCDPLRGTRARAAAAGVALVLATATGWPAAQPALPRISIDVSVDIDDFGAPPRLDPADFEIRAAGHHVPVTGVTINRQPLQMVLLLDLSASITRRVEKDAIKDHVREMFIDRLQPGEAARIGGFTGALRLSADFSSDRRALHRALDAALDHGKRSTFGPSPIWDHTYDAVDAFSRVSGRKTVILLTDGRGTGNRRSMEEVVEHAIRVGATVNVISLDRQLYIQQDASTAVVVRPRNVLLWIAEVTGGRVITMVHEPREPMGPGRALGEFLADLRQVYTLHFDAPAVEGRFHKLDVVVKHPSATIRAPQVYYSTTNTQSPTAK
jgi:VWFA-related protein